MVPRLFIFPTLLLGILLLSCGEKDSDPMDAVAIRTEAVSTYAFSLTETLAPRPTASPTLTSLPSFTPLPVTETLNTTPTLDSCYDLLWIEDQTIPDGTHMKADEVFIKTWLVQNSGGCAWPPGFTFQHVGGDPMRGKTIVLRDPIPVGAKREISVELVVPAGLDGLIQGSWRMADSSGNYFGDTLSVNIVVGVNTTPAVTNTP